MMCIALPVARPRGTEFEARENRTTEGECLPAEGGRINIVALMMVNR
jgi:hypothetical protein